MDGSDNKKTVNEDILLNNQESPDQNKNSGNGVVSDHIIENPGPSSSQKGTEVNNLSDKKHEIPSTSAAIIIPEQNSKSQEMNFYLEKLKEMVPYTKNSAKLSKVQLIHSAIDYITDLQESLEARIKSNSPVNSSRAPLSNLSATQQQNSLNIQSDLNNPPDNVLETDLILPELNPSRNAVVDTIVPSIPFPVLEESNLASSSNLPPTSTSQNRKDTSDSMKKINEYFIRSVIEGQLIDGEQGVEPHLRSSSSSTKDFSVDTKETKIDLFPSSVKLSSRELSDNVNVVGKVKSLHSDERNIAPKRKTYLDGEKVYSKNEEIEELLKKTKS